MRILLLAPIYLGLYKNVVEELERQGHEVVHVTDRFDLPFDPYLRPHSLRQRVGTVVKRIVTETTGIRKRYWKRMVATEPRLADCRFDFLLCINGSSFHPWLLRHLRAQNPAIKSCLYVWDSDTYRNFFHNVPYFDRAMSFDIFDCQNSRYDVPFLPFYWQPGAEAEGIKYDISMIGSAHGDRVRILNDVLSQIGDRADISHFFRIYSPTEVAGLPEGCQMHKPMPMAEVNRVIAQSRCVFDTSRDCQGGTTPRFIWAMAMGKKIITTNSSIARMPLYDERQIRIVDAEHPVIDWDFVKSEGSFTPSEYVNQLRIDRWVKMLLGELPLINA